MCQQSKTMECCHACVCVCVAVTLYTLSKTKECCNVFVCLCVVVTLYVNRTVIVQKAIGVQGIKR